MPDVLQIGDRVEIPISDLMWRFSRASGPGGQHVNKADSRVELVFDLAGCKAIPSYLRKRAIERLGVQTISIVASESRSQYRNRQVAERRLVDTLVQAFAPPPPPRRATKPSKASKEKRLDSKHRRSELKRTRRQVED